MPIASRTRGAVTIPLEASTARPLLRDADPAIFYALEYFAHVIRATVGDRLAAEGVLANRSDLTDAVAHAIPVDPKRVALQEYLEFPLLAVYRIRDTNQDRTIQLRSEGGVIGIDYVLPPMSAADAERLSPVLHAVAVALDVWTDGEPDASYTPSGGVPGDSPWGPTFANVEKISIDTVSYGTFQNNDDLPFYAISIQGTLKERDTLDESSLEPLETVGTAFDVQDNADGTTVPDVAKIDVDIPT